ncbi:MAG: hypothetical protein JXR70_18635 [Spirochaetales bacterium]|nr:hypothetical protein [Spirochaetales bacterium]
MSSSTSFSLVKILQLLLALLLLLLGIQGIINYNSFFGQLGRGIARLDGGPGNILPMIVAVLNIIAGTILLMEIFMAQVLSFLTPAKMAVTLYYLIYTVYSMFFINFEIVRNSIVFKPDIWSWLVILVGNLVYLLGLFMVSRRSA